MGQNTTSTQTWDRRSWTIALVAGNITGLTTFLCTYAPTGYIINYRMFHLMARLHLHFYATQMIAVCSAVLCIIVIPLILSGTAKRYTLLWGLPPMAIFFLWREGSDIAQRQFDPTDLWAIPLAMAVALLVTSGPIALGRWLIRRRRERFTSISASEDYHTGVWPPPPKSGD